MQRKKYAFLLDFDGTFFRTDLIKDHLIRVLNISEHQWDRLYSEARDDRNYVDFARVIRSLATTCRIDENRLWALLDKTVQEPVFFPTEAKEAMTQFKYMGHTEIITQGEKRTQTIKLNAAGVPALFNPEDMHIIEGDKVSFLKQRVETLVREGYSDIFQIDDRSTPLREVQAAYPEQVIPVRIRGGKYGREPNFAEGSLDAVLQSRWIDIPTIAHAHQKIKELGVGSSEGCVSSDRMRR